MKVLVYPKTRNSIAGNHRHSNAYVKNQGFSLIELVITIVVLGIALSALTSSLFTGIGRNADPLWQSKASQLSQAYLDEILSMRFAETSPLGGGAIGTCAIAGSEVDETSRSLYDDVDDYHGLTETAGFLDTTTVSGYSGYAVSIEVTCVEQGNLAPFAKSKLIALTITSPVNQKLVFSVLRADL
ncbi:MAG: prepilin-type N-terminal cleavage/methylation domain-containing protein [Oleispira sp.]